MTSINKACCLTTLKAIAVEGGRLESGGEFVEYHVTVTVSHTRRRRIFVQGGECNEVQKQTVVAHTGLYRFSALHDLSASLGKRFPEVAGSIDFPRKTFFAKNDDDEFISERAAGLQKYFINLLNAIAAVSAESMPPDNPMQTLVKPFLRT